MKDYYSIKEFSKKINVTAQTLRNWERSGRLIPHHKTANGYRYYSHEQLIRVLNQTNTHASEKTTIGYCRVSSAKQNFHNINKSERIRKLNDLSFLRRIFGYWKADIVVADLA